MHVMNEVGIIFTWLGRRYSDGSWPFIASETLIFHASFFKQRFDENTCRLQRPTVGSVSLFLLNQQVKRARFAAAKSPKRDQPRSER